ncbi:hypothetical protein L1887_25815 [Cichorium endivia]|nr:hypothetical protein L1887_25815 [Cichorium endivia]
MDISGKLLKFKFHISIVVISSVIFLFLLYFAPKFLDVLTYFWPLLLSTALFFITVVVFGRTTQPSLEFSGEKAGEEILDYVAGHPETDESCKAE